jgi:hypothetical protein
MSSAVERQSEGTEKVVRDIRVATRRQYGESLWLITFQLG